MNHSFLNIDGTISIQPATLTTLELDMFIQELLLAREHMQPPIPNQVSEQPFDILVTHDPRIQITPEQNGEITLSLGTTGQWCVVTLPVRQAALVRDAFVQFVQGTTDDIFTTDRCSRLLQ